MATSSTLTTPSPDVVASLAICKVRDGKGVSWWDTTKRSWSRWLGDIRCQWQHADEVGARSIRCEPVKALVIAASLGAIAGLLVKRR